MALFNFGKKKEDKNVPTCCYGGSEPKAEKAASCCGKTVGGICCIKVLGAGCKTCHQQYENVKEAVRNLDLSVEVEYITDMEKVMEYGVMVMPAIVINEKVAASGKLLSTRDVEKLLRG